MISEMSSMYKTLVELDHWTVRQGVNDRKSIMYNMHDILNERNRAVDPAFQAMYDRLMVILRSVHRVPTEERVFTWHNVRTVLGDKDNAYTVMTSQLVGNPWNEYECQIAALIVYGEKC
jgi:hypothetical protein